MVDSVNNSWAKGIYELMNCLYRSRDDISYSTICKIVPIYGANFPKGKNTFIDFCL